MPTDPSTRALAEHIVTDVMNSLGDRKGFDWWWGDIDVEIKKEIRLELTEIVRGHLDG